MMDSGDLLKGLDARQAFLDFVELLSASHPLARYHSDKQKKVIIKQDQVFLDISPNTGELTPVQVLSAYC